MLDQLPVGHREGRGSLKSELYSCMSFNMQSTFLGVVTETEGAGENCHPSGGVIFSSSFPTMPPLVGLFPSLA